jgi:hypothetical protein
MLLGWGLSRLFVAIANVIKWLYMVMRKNIKIHNIYSMGQN